MSKRFRSLEVFAGCGGLALGLEKAGFKNIGLVENNSDAVKTLQHNRPSWHVIEEDVAVFAQGDLEDRFGIKSGELDLLSGGPPCQAFSYAGRRMGLSDTRGTLFYPYAEILHKLKPCVFVFENVKGLVTHDSGRTFELIMKVLCDAGYKLNLNVLNAGDYGVPQRRERLFVTGIREDIAEKYQFKLPLKHKYKPVLSDVLIDCPPSRGIEYNEAKRKVMSLVPPGGNWRSIDPVIAMEYMKGCWFSKGGRTGILRRMSMDEQSLTILTTPTQKTTERCHPLETRPFTIRESARIQTFPDDYEFIGSMLSQYRQIGNAVPVNLAYEMGRSIADVLVQYYRGLYLAGNTDILKIKKDDR